MATPEAGFVVPSYDIYVNGSKFSNPLYFKMSIIAFLASWPLALMCYTIYFYHIFKYNYSRVTAKMYFFPMLLFSGIMDNVYDIATGAKVSEYHTTTLGVMIGVFVTLGVISIIYTAAYTMESMSMNKYMPLSQREEENVIFSADDERVTISNRVPSDHWGKIIEEYMTANVIWGLTSYNMMLVLIYVSRYITHTDNNYIREVDVAIMSGVLLIFIVFMAVFDFFLFRNPSSGSVFMHYIIAAVFALNFTIDFQAHVGYCEILTLVVFFFAVFLAVYKLKMYIDIGVSAGKKKD